ncbi:hypothetical protein SAMN05216266_10932 [Amycolatopsis marina]|uniref:Uncharacterized protein n=1 Tax=Amycolatopsis marina TaxID=490629 RepID=A0A1I1AEW8_9PSEU|nr:hypothetical protein [Amycolatopsis marina]SFB36032.1 hypothetical protein SAMN05216266_10932 [Amycolatopsis marina]
MPSGAAATTSADPVPVAPHCKIERLPEPGNYRQSLVFGTDPTGRYLVGRGYGRDGDDKARVPLLWDNGRASVLPFEHKYTEATEVNSNGTVIAWGTEPEMFQDGVVTELPYDKDTVSSVTLSGINERGDISASLWLKSDNIREKTVPAYYPAGKHDAPPVTLPVPDTKRSGYTLDVDEDGTMVGWVTTAEGMRAYVWHPDGSHGFLPAPEGSVTRTTAHEIRDGWVVGRGKIDGEPRTLRWRLDDDTVEVMAGSTGFDINAQGWTVGTDDSNHAAVVISGKLLQLPGLNPQEPNDEAQAISDGGKVIGGAVTLPDSTERHAVRWECR